jgi:hypothetical protein
LIPIELPIYRVANMRTSVRQAAYVAQRGLPSAYFATGQEDPSVQQAQHQILAELSKDAKANIYAKLEETAEQQEALIVTADGVVLNGNRRLSAMRELYDSDPGRYSRYSHVEVAVLPAHATEDDLTAIETRLQIAPDLKLQYGWVEKAIGLRRQLEELQWPLTKAAESWDESEGELKALLVMLQVADDYLTRYLGRAGAYNEVAAHEQAFRTFVDRQRSRQATADPSRLEAERFALFAVLANQARTSGRTYDYARQIEAVTDGVLASVPVGAPDPEPTAEQDPLDPLPVSGDTISSAVLDYLRRNDNGGEVAELATDTLEAIQNETRARRRGGAFLADATKLNSLLGSMVAGNAESATLAPAAIQLMNGLAGLVDKIRELITAQPASRASLNRAKLQKVQTALAEIAAMVAEE